MYCVFGEGFVTATKCKYRKSISPYSCNFILIPFLYQPDGVKQFTSFRVLKVSVKWKTDNQNGYPFSLSSMLLFFFKLMKTYPRPSILFLVQISLFP